jgi:long-chain fatty acid transport protein
VGANAEHSDATLGQALPNLSAALPDGAEQLKGSGWDWGWSAGAQARFDAVSLGFAYKSSITHTLKGQATLSGLLGPLAGENASFDTSARFRTPWQAILGARYRLTPALTLDGQIVRFGWSEFDAISLSAPISAAIPENYRDTWSYAVGADFALNPQWTVRAGVQYDETPTQDGRRDPRVPDGDRINVGLGASYQATRALAIDAAASYSIFHDASIDRPTAAYAGTPAQTPILTAGELTDASALVLSVGGRFSF